MRGNVGRIGFHHQAAQRQLGGQAAQLQGAVVGHRPAKPQLEAQRNKRLGLLQAAVEGMGDAPAYLHLAQYLQKLVGRAAHMQDDGQIKPPRQHQLLAVKALLAFGVQPRHKVVEPDFAHRHQARVSAVLLQGVGQQLQVFVLRAAGVQGVNAQGVAVAMAVGQQAHAVPVAALYRGQHAMHHALGPGLLAHRVHIVRQLGRIQVGVGVNPGHGPQVHRSAQHARGEPHHPVAARGQ